MSGNSWIRLITAFLCCGLAATMSLAETRVGSTSNDTTNAAGSPGQKIVVYYLYFNPRCDMCINMELYSKEAVETGFPDAVKSGLVEWHAYNMDSTEHAHFWNDFQLETKSLVMVDKRDGKMRRWKDCKQIWDLVEDKSSFLAYVQREVRAYLNTDSAQSDSLSP